MIYWEEFNHSWWNHIVKDDKTNTEAVNDDIVGQVTLIDENYGRIEIAFLCQRDNEQNNIVAIRLTEGQNVKSIKMMYYFMLILLEIYEIEYVAVHGKFKFLSKFWPFALQNKQDIWYCDLLKAKEMLNNELKGEIYE